MMQKFVIDEKQIRAQGQTDGVTHYSTGVMVVKDKKALVVKRVPGDHLGSVWELPGGGVDDTESIQGGAIREAKEETGLKVKNVLGTFKGMDYSTPKKPKARQINIIVEVEDGPVVLEPSEHDDYKYISLSDLNSLECTDNMRDCIRDGLSRVEQT